jgi:hypothetical protein
LWIGPGALAEDQKEGEDSDGEAAAAAPPGSETLSADPAIPSGKGRASEAALAGARLSAAAFN